MEQQLMKHENIQLNDHNDKFQTFRQIRKEAGLFGYYQKRLFVLMGFYWITASFFLILPFYFFKSPVYCQNVQNNVDSQCIECLQDCKNQLCSLYGNNIRDYIQKQGTLTYQFSLFCGLQGWRVFYRICPQTLPFFGLLIYGYVADRKGRKLAFKISWRFYAIGLIIYTFTQTQFLISLGYFIACVNCFPSLVIQFVLLFQQIDRSVRLRACYLLLSYLLIAPLIATFLADQLVQFGRKITLSILCTVPAVILAMVTSLLQQSALFAYKDDKLYSFNIVNKIAKINKVSPITIDLSKSSWMKLNYYKVSFLELIRHKQNRQKIFLSVFFMLVFEFNTKLAQIQLDQFTNQYVRGTLMYGTSALATVSVIILITKYQVNKFFYLTCLTPFISLLDIIFTLANDNTFIIQSIISIALRYFSSLAYSMFLIWTILTFPTICRARCVGLALCGYSLGSALAYSLASFPFVQLCISLSFSLVVLLQSARVKLDYENKLIDTLSNEYYDQNDKFRIN